MTLSQIDLTIGVVLLGTLIGSILYGFATVQLYTYSGRCQGDPRWLIVFVYIIWVAETTLTVLSICYIYDLAVSNFGNPEDILRVPWTIVMFIILQGLVSTSVQAFFGYRVWKVSNSLKLPALIWLGLLVRASLTITMGILSAIAGVIPVIEARYGTIIILSFSVSVVMDILNVVSLTWALSASRGGVDRTSRMVDKLILYSIETGLITSFAGICILVTRVTMTNNFVWIGIFQFYPKLYSNTLMASLNARAGLRHKYMTDVPTMSMPSGVHGRPERSGVSIQMVSLMAAGDPSQKQTQDRLSEQDGTESADRRTLTDLPFKAY